MEDKRRAEGAPAKNIQELIKRCKAMEQEIADLKRRMMDIQRQIQTELTPRKQNPNL